MAWSDDTAMLLRPHSAGRIYANFQSVDGPGSANAVFGRNHARLFAIKKTYSDHSCWREPLTIRLSSIHSGVAFIASPAPAPKLLSCRAGVTIAPISGSWTSKQTSDEPLI